MNIKTCTDKELIDSAIDWSRKGVFDSESVPVIAEFCKRLSLKTRKEA